MGYVIPGRDGMGGWRWEEIKNGHARKVQVLLTKPAPFARLAPNFSASQGTKPARHFLEIFSMRSLLL